MQDPLTIALRYLKFRPRTVFEIEQKLKSKGIKEQDIQKTIQVLKYNKLLDDLEFAKMWVRDRNNLKPSGSYLLKMELRKLGVENEIIDEVLEGQDEEMLVRKALESKSRYRKADFQKRAGFLARRGFSTGMIYKILKNT